MEKLKKYQQIIQQELQRFTKIKAANMPNVENQLVVNEDRTQFIILSIGWHKAEYIHDWMFHIQIKDDNTDVSVWIHEDTTDFNIAAILKRSGISAENIVLGFVRPNVETSHLVVV